MGDVEKALINLHCNDNDGWRYAKSCLDTADQNTRRRNVLAEQAGRDHRHRAEQLLTMYRQTGSLYRVIEELKQHRDHAEHWERQFNEWGQLPYRQASFEHGYAAHVHGAGAESYRETLSQLNQLRIEPEGDAVASVVLLNGCNGHTDATVTDAFTVHEGYQWDHELTAELQAKIWAKAEAAGNLLVAKVKAEAGMEVSGQVRSANTIKFTRSTTCETKIQFNTNRPCWVYQVETMVPMKNAKMVVLWGSSYFVSHKLLHI